MTQFLFYFFAAITVAAAILVVTAPKPTRALLSLILAMFSLAVIYLFLGAYFVAMTHIIVYAGAVLVLFLFVIMLQGTGAVEVPLAKRFNGPHVLFAGIAAIALVVLLISILAKTPGQPSGFAGDTETFGLSLFKDYLLAFELTSLLLLIGVFSAVSLAKKDSE